MKQGRTTQKENNTNGIEPSHMSDDYVSIYPTYSVFLCVDAKARGWRGEGRKAMLSVAKSVYPAIFLLIYGIPK